MNMWLLAFILFLVPCLIMAAIVVISHRVEKRLKQDTLRAREEWMRMRGERG